MIGSSSQNLLKDGTFINTTVNQWQYADWRSYNSTTSLNTGLFIANNTIKIIPPINRRVRLYKSILCGTGTQIGFSFDCESNFDNVNDKLVVGISFFDSVGLQLYGITSITINQTNQSSPANTYYAATIPAPSGTAYGRINLSTDNSAGGGNAATGNSYCILSNLNAEVISGQASALFYDSTGTSTNGAVDLQPIGISVAGSSTGLTKIYTDNVIGSRVFFDLNVGWTTFTGTGELRIINLPRPISSSASPAFNIISTSSLIISAGYNLVAFGVAGSTSLRIKLFEQSTGNLTDFPTMPNTANFYISGSYQYGTI